MTASKVWFLCAAGVMAILASAGLLVGRPIHLGSGPTPRETGTLVAAATPRIGLIPLPGRGLPPSRAFTPTPSRPGAPPSAVPMTPAASAGDELAPSTVLVPEYRNPSPTLRAPQGGNFAAAPTRSPAPTPNQVWTELPSTQAQPTLRVYHSDAASYQNTTLVVWGGGFSRTWTGWGSGRIIEGSLPAGVYRYEIRGPSYRRSGEPDMAGTLRCQRFRLYDLELCYRGPGDPDGTIFEDLGDRR